MTNEKLESLIEKYKLSNQEHKRIFQFLKQLLFSNKTPEKEPSFMFVIGQPGCGKTTFINSGLLSNYLIINSDEYRKFNKNSDEIYNEYPTYYTKLTNYDAHLWGDELFSYAVNNGYSVLREKAPINYNLIKIIKEISEKNNVIVNVVVTGNLNSALATRERYEKELLKNSNARLSNIDSHNKCYNLLPEFISMCLSLNIKVNYIVPRNNKFEIIPVKKDDYLNLLHEIRRESNEDIIIEYKTRINSIIESMKKRNASSEQYEELKKIEDIYLDLTNSFSVNKQM